MEERQLLLAVTLDDYNLHHSHFSLNVGHTALSAAPTPDPCFKFRINLAESWKPRFSWYRNVNCCFQMQASQYFSSLPEIHDDEANYISSTDKLLTRKIGTLNLRSHEKWRWWSTFKMFDRPNWPPHCSVCVRSSSLIIPAGPLGPHLVLLLVRCEHNAQIEPIQRLNAPLSDWGVQQ